MSTPPDRPQLPAHLRPLTVEIPRIWTPEEALVVFELIDDLRDKVWALYNLQLQDQLREQCAPRVDARSGSQGWPKATAKRRLASLTVASTTAASPQKDDGP